MDIAQVTGNVWATKKDERLNGMKLLIVKPLGGGGEFAACDIIGAGEGDIVLVTRGGGARISCDADIPADAAVVGIIDKITGGTPNEY